MINSVRARLSAIVALLIVLNTAVFLLCMRAAGTPFLPWSLLVASGALTPDATRPEQVWRVIASGFLHADPLHLLANLVSLAICGPFLERRLGASAFMLVYGLSMAGAGLASLRLHSDAIASVGASGALSGIIGALFALWVLGATELSPGFFLANFALNFAVATHASNVDWAGHIGGFAVGLACVAMLDIATRANAVWLRCRFPEFVKMNTMLLIGLSGAYCWQDLLPLPAPDDQRWIAVAGWVTIAVAFIKLLDVLLAARRGLAAVVFLLAIGNGLSAAIGWTFPRPMLELDCRYARDFGPLTNDVASTVCGRFDDIVYVIGASGIAITLVMYAFPLRRGLLDVGFVGATFVGERKRQRGLVRPTRHTRV